MNIIRGKKEFSSLVSGYAVENKMLAESLPVHSFGGVELIKLAKCKAAELLKFEGNSRFGRPLESIIYFGSLDDIELPLLAGVKEIYLVDPGLEEAVIEHLISRVKHYGKNVSYDETKKVLTFDLESRSVVTRLFQETMQEFNQREAIKVEGVLMFNKAPGMEKAEAEKALLPNGFCLDNKNH